MEWLCLDELPRHLAPVAGDLPDLGETFGPRLKRLRDAARLTQARLARIAGLAKSSVEQLERGRSPPALDSARRLARALEISINALLGDPEPPRRRSASMMAVLREPPLPGYKAVATTQERIDLLLRSLPEDDLSMVEKLLTTWENERARLQKAKPRPHR